MSRSCWSASRLGRWGKRPGRCGPRSAPRPLSFPLQNGVDAASELAAALGSGHVLAGLPQWTFELGDRPRSDPQRRGRPTSSNFAELDNRAERANGAICGRLSEGGCRPSRSLFAGRARAALWEKFLTVTSVGGVGAVTRAAIGVTSSTTGNPAAARAMHERSACRRPVLARSHWRMPMVADTMTFIDTRWPRIWTRPRCSGISSTASRASSNTGNGAVSATGARTRPPRPDA